MHCTEVRDSQVVCLGILMESTLTEGFDTFWHLLPARSGLIVFKTFNNTGSIQKNE